MSGYIKIQKEYLKKIKFKNKPELFTLWFFLLENAYHSDCENYYVDFKNSNTFISLKRGQFVSGRKKIAEACGIHESNIENRLKSLVMFKEISQQKFSKYRVITINNYDEIVGSSQQNNNKITTKSQQNNTKEIRNKKEINKEEIYYCPEENKLKNLDIEFFKNMFPEIDIEFEINSMNVWLEENPKKRKKKYKTFIINWLKRCMENKNNKKSNNNNNYNDNFHLIEKIISDGKYRSESQLHLLPELEAEFVRSLPCGFNTINEVSGNEFEYNKIKKQYKNFIKEKM